VADFNAMAEKIIEEQPVKARLFVDMQIVGKLPRDDQVRLPMLEMSSHDLCITDRHSLTHDKLPKEL